MTLLAPTVQEDHNLLHKGKAVMIVAPAVQKELDLLSEGKAIMIAVAAVIQETDEVALKTRSFKNLAEL